MRAALLALALVGCQPAHAQEGIPCLPIDQARTMFADRYGEVSVGYGLGATNDHVIEVFVSAAGSFTVVMVKPDGTACLLAQGFEWTFVEKPWPKVGVDG